MLSGDMVGNVKGVIVLDNEGRRIIAKYYNEDLNVGLQTTSQQKEFERSLFTKSNKQEGAAKLNMYENDIMNVDDYVAVFRCYTDMTVYVLGDGKYDNELMNLETSYQTLFTGLDADENDILNAYDLNNFFYWQTDKLMTEGSWNMQTGELFG